METLSRRTLLRGLGRGITLSIGLPLLDAMRPSRLIGAAPPVAIPVRMAFVFFPNGAVMRDWMPQQTGEQFELPRTLAALADFKSDITVLGGLAQDNGRDKGDGPGDHARAASTFLTGAHPVKTQGANIRVGVSVDQIAAAKIGDRTRLPSLEIGTERGQNAGGCDSGYSCAYSANISWKTPTTPMSKEIIPRLVLDRMFGMDRGGPKNRDFYRKSILDFVSEDAAQLKDRLGQNDRRKLDEYFVGVRELEQRIARAEKVKGEAAPDVKIPAGVPAEVQEHVRLMYDLLTLAFRTDSTRVATYMLANAGSNRSYPMVGVNEGHHELSHHGSNEEKLEKIQKIDRFLMDQFAYFLGQLKAIPEGDGTLLDHSMILYGSGLADGNAHHHHDLPLVLAGRGGGTIRTGRHLRMERETPLNNLFLSMLDRMGAAVDQLGDSNGRLTQLDS